MSNERKLRLIQVAKEFKVGLNTITDFMQKKGIKSDGSPNTLVESEVYTVLEKEFGGNRPSGSARESVRERISQKQASVTLEGVADAAHEDDKELVIKSNTIEIKDQIQQPRILGKMDLTPRPKNNHKSTPASASAPATAVKPATAPVSAPVAEVKVAPKPTVVAPPAVPVTSGAAKAAKAAPVVKQQHPAAQSIH
ncbi:MAG: translation initiation factor IF-2, partial [Alistipes sp.]